MIKCYYVLKIHMFESEARNQATEKEKGVESDSLDMRPENEIMEIQGLGEKETVEIERMGEKMANGTSGGKLFFFSYR